MSLEMDCSEEGTALIQLRTKCDNVEVCLLAGDAKPDVLDPSGFSGYRMLIFRLLWESYKAFLILAFKVHEVCVGQANVPSILLGLAGPKRSTTVKDTFAKKMKYAFSFSS